MGTVNQKKQISAISRLHFIRLFYRSGLFLAAAAVYVMSRVLGSEMAFGGIEDRHWILGLIWIVFAVEIVFRFFPSKYESMGCQKQFAANYVPGKAERHRFSSAEKKQIREQVQSGKRTLAVVLAWFALNGLIGLLYFRHIIDVGILVLISLAYSVCDMICILFFCPFQEWFMKNRCCSSCRIYNWDFAMMFTPMIFVKSLWGWSLLGLSLALLARWEIYYRMHPERFSIYHNNSLSCASCREKLCHHKTSLKNFLRKEGARFRQVPSAAMNAAGNIVSSRLSGGKTIDGVMAADSVSAGSSLSERGGKELI